jgi:hypothetical protein
LLHRDLLLERQEFHLFQVKLSVAGTDPKTLFPPSKPSCSGKSIQESQEQTQTKRTTKFFTQRRMLMRKESIERDDLEDENDDTQAHTLKL